MERVFNISDTGITFVPRYVKQVSDMEYGSVVSHENYNEKLNLNTTQGDYNTEILKLLFEKENPAETPHVRYLDKIITDEVNRIDGVLDNHQTQINNLGDRITNVANDLTDLSHTVTNIINGVTKVGKAVAADRIAGVENAGIHKYYGTDYAGNAGFHSMPDALYADNMSSGSVEINGIYYVPREDSIAESMLTEELRTKINRETISDYDLLLNRPSINSVLLTGNKSLSDLGIQPAGNYLTEIPNIYATKSYVNSTVSPYLLASTAAETYATAEGLQSAYNNIVLINERATAHAEYAEGRYARICVNTFSGTPKTGDLLISL